MATQTSSFESTFTGILWNPVSVRDWNMADSICESVPVMYKLIRTFDKTC